MTRTKTPTGPQGVAALLHSPAEAAAAFVDYAGSIDPNAPGITWGIPEVDAFAIPVLKGKVVGIMGRPGSGKSSLLLWMAYREAEAIAARGKAGEEVVVFASLEEMVEDLETAVCAKLSQGAIRSEDVARGTADMESVRLAAAKRIELPLWTIGHSVARAGTDKPRMTVANMIKAVRSVERVQKRRPTLFCLDYIQRLPVTGAGSDRVQQLSAAPKLVAEMAQMLAVPVIMGIQAHPRVDGYDLKIPRAGDTHWAQAIYQDLDVIYGLWRPAVTEEEGDEIVVNKRRWAVTEELFVMELLKQRRGRPRRRWVLRFAPWLLNLCGAEESIHSHFQKCGL